LRKRLPFPYGVSPRRVQNSFTTVNNTPHPYTKSGQSADTLFVPALIFTGASLQDALQEGEQVPREERRVLGEHITYGR